MASHKKDSGSGLKLIQHKHCAVCGKAQLVGEPEVCSAECKKIMEDNIKKKRMWWIYIAIGSAVLALIMFLQFFVKF